MTARFLSPEKALLQLSFRYLTDDHFWFTVFHEMGHLLLHGEKELLSAALRDEVRWILEAPDQLSTCEEKEASQFAADTLIPPELQSVFATVPTDQRAVIRFAVRAGISPGIVVGQLQHVGRIKYDQMNSLKRRFRWND